MQKKVNTETNNLKAFGFYLYTGDIPNKIYVEQNAL